MARILMKSLVSKLNTNHPMVLRLRVAKSQLKARSRKKKLPRKLLPKRKRNELTYSVRHTIII